MVNGDILQYFFILITPVITISILVYKYGKAISIDTYFGVLFLSLMLGSAIFILFAFIFKIEYNQRYETREERVRRKSEINNNFYKLLESKFTAMFLN